MSSELTEHHSKLPRRQSVDIADRVAVRRALVGVVNGIEDLQREAVLLQALVSRSPTVENYQERLIAIAQNVRRTSRCLDEAGGTLDQRRRDHSIVRDLTRTVANLARLVSRLTQPGGAPVPSEVIR